MMQSGWPMAVAIPLTLLLGLLCGLVNAALIHYTGISPLVITLGTLYLYGGGRCCSPAWRARRAMRASAASRTALPRSLT